MPADLTAARHYLAAPSGGFWAWSDGGEVVTWVEGDTLSFRAELLAVLSRLAPHGLPPLDDVLLLLAACREHWRASMVLVDVPWSGDGTLYEIQNTLPEWMQSALDGLIRVHELPAELRESPEAKAVLAEAVFDGRAPLVPPDVAATVVEILKAGPGADASWLQATWTLRSEAIQNSLRLLGRALRRVDAEALRLRRRTGLDQLVAPADVGDEREEGGLRELLVRLSDDPELGGMARLARNLMAVVQLPRAISEPEDLPLGGVSDVANRGPLDRLLLSELAHDDLTLAVRVAVNEALYLRRESPPRTPPEQRAILIDAGLRLWGVPRLFATSVALALTANSDSPVTAWTSANAASPLAQADLSTREGLMEQLERLDPRLHAAAALPAFRDELAKLGDAPDALLVTAAETFDDPEFQRALAEAELPQLYVATVERSGGFRLWLRTLRGRRCLREAQLDLDAILAPKPAPAPKLIERRDASGVAAIQRVTPFPLRLPHRVDWWNVFRAGPGALYALTADGRLMLWDDRQRGARQVAEGLPRGERVWSEVDDEQPHPRTRLLLRHKTSHQLVLVSVDVETGAIQTARLEHAVDQPGAAFRSRDCVVVRSSWSYSGLFAAYDLSSGERVDVHLCRDTGCVVGPRFWLSQKEPRLRAVSVEDGRLRETAVPLPESARGMRELAWPLKSQRAFLEQEGHDGPFVIPAATGEFVCLVHGTRRPLSAGMATPVNVLDADANGRRVLVEAKVPTAPPGRALGEGRFIVDVESGRRTPVPAWVITLSQWDAREHTSSRLLRRTFRAVLAVAGPTLALVSRSGALWRISLEGGTMRLLSTGTAGGSAARPFEPLPRPRGAYSMKAAAFRDGSRVLLDGRGLLHLRSSRPEIPEATLVLHPDHISGWCSDGRTWGDRYFLASDPTAEAERMFFDVLQPFARGLS